MADKEIEAVLKLKDELSGKVNLVNKNLKGLNKQVTAQQKSLDKLGKGLGGVRLKYIAVAAAITAMVRVAKGALDAQANQEQAINALNLALANQGNLLSGTSQRLQEYAAGLQEVTTSGDETILQAQSLLATFGMNEEQLKTTTIAALDFAAATGRDLRSAVNLLGKAFVGETGELSRYGIVIDKNIPKSEKFAAVMEQMSSRFGGMAQAEVATFSGRMTQFSNAVGDAQESLGVFIGQLFDFGTAGGVGIGAMQWLADFFQKDLVIALGWARKAFAELFAHVLKGVALLAAPLGKLSKWLGIDMFEDARQGLKAFAQGLDDAGDALLAEAKALAEAGRKLLGFKNNTDDAGDAVVYMTLKIKEGIAPLSSLSASLDGLAVSTSRFQFAAENFKFFGDADQQARMVALEIEKLRIKMGSEFPDAIETTSSAIKELTDEQLEEIIGKTVTWNEVTGALTGVLGAAGNVLAIFGVDIDSVIGKITRFISALKGIWDAVTGLIGIFKNLSGGLGGFVNALGGAGSAAGSAAGAVGGIGGGVGGAAGAAAGGVGAAVGAIGGAVGSAMSAIAAGLAAIGPAGWIALAGLGAFVAVKAIFGGKSEYEKVGEEFGRDFGFGISEGLQHHIVNLSEDVFGGDRLAAMSLAMGEIIKEGITAGADPNFLMEQIGNVFSRFDEGRLTAEQASQSLTASVAAIMPVLDQMGEGGVLQMERILSAAERTGVGFEGMDEFAREYVERARELGISVNDVTLRALGLEDALKKVEGTGDGAGEAMSDLASAGTEAMSEILKETIESGAGIEELKLLTEGLGLGLEEMGLEGVGAFDDMTDKAKEFERAAREAGRAASDIPPPGGGDGGGGGQGTDYYAQGGLHIPRLTKTSTITAHPNEYVHIGKAGSAVPAQSSVQHIHFNVEGREFQDYIIKTVDGATTIKRGRVHPGAVG